jgi:hypothetical protein
MSIHPDDVQKLSRTFDLRVLPVKAVGTSTRSLSS